MFPKGFLYAANVTARSACGQSSMRALTLRVNAAGLDAEIVGSGEVCVRPILMGAFGERRMILLSPRPVMMAVI